MRLQPHSNTGPVRRARNRLGENPEPAWEESQNGCRKLRPQAHQ